MRCHRPAQRPHVTQVNLRPGQHQDRFSWPATTEGSNVNETLAWTLGNLSASQVIAGA